MKKAETGRRKRTYPVITYLVGLFAMVIALVVLSYLMGLRDRQELTTDGGFAAVAEQYVVTETD